MPAPPHASPIRARSAGGPRLRLWLLGLLLTPLVLAVITRQHDPAFATIPMPPTTTPMPAADAKLPTPLLGVAINCHHISNLPLYLEAVDAIAAMGANTIILVTPHYQQRVESTRIRFRRTHCPQRTQLVEILNRAEKHGLATVLMPIVLLEEPGEKGWRGVLAPDDWSDWWESYYAFIEDFARLAVETNVDLFSIGSELNSTEHQIERWEEVIRRVRSRGFDGPLLYSSNWDRYDKTQLWPLVDVMGVSSYFELERDTRGADVPALRAAWTPIQEDLLAVARDQGKPLLLTEVGYPSLPWANQQPWNYVAANGEPADHEAQARSWRAFFLAWTPIFNDSTQPTLGFCAYRWDPYHHGDEHDTGYGLVGKPAWRTVEAGFEVIREARAVTAPRK